MAVDVSGAERLRRSLQFAGLVEQSEFVGDQGDFDDYDRTLTFFYNPQQPN